MRPQCGKNRVKVSQMQVNAVVAVAGDDDPSFALRALPRDLDGCQVLMQQCRIVTGQIADRRALNVDTDGVPVMRIAVLRDQPGSNRQAGFPAACLAGSRHPLSSADALKSRLVEVLTDDTLPGITG